MLSGERLEIWRDRLAKKNSLDKSLISDEEVEDFYSRMKGAVLNGIHDMVLLSSIEESCPSDTIPSSAHWPSKALPENWSNENPKGLPEDEIADEE